jgi:hypothetical protein
MTIKVIQWATGGVGRAAVAGIVAHPDLELVGCWVHSRRQGRHGRGRAVRHRAPRGDLATDDVEELLALGADCVVYSPIMADPRWWPASWRRAPTW